MFQRGKTQAAATVIDRSDIVRTRLGKRGGMSSGPAMEARIAASSATLRAIGPT